MGYFKSARLDIVRHLRKEGVPLVRRHALGVLDTSNEEIPQVGYSLGWATDALKSSGHVVMAGDSDAAYQQAIDAAIQARMFNKALTKDPDLVQFLGEEDFLPPLEIPKIPAVAKASVYYPTRYAMPLELGFTLHSGMHPQALFLMRAVMSREESFYADAEKLVRSLGNFNVTQVDPNNYPGKSGDSGQSQRQALLRELEQQERQLWGEYFKNRQALRGQGVNAVLFEQFVNAGFGGEGRASLFSRKGESVQKVWREGGMVTRKGTTFYRQGGLVRQRSRVNSGESHLELLVDRYWRWVENLEGAQGNGR